MGNKRGQVSMDFILSMIFLMLVSIFIYSTELTFSNGVTNGYIVDKLYSIADTFEDYAILAYAKNENITLKLKPIGDLGYVIHFSNKVINVSYDTFILITPTKNGVKIYSDKINISPTNVGNNITITTIIDGKNITIWKKSAINIS